MPRASIGAAPCMWMGPREVTVSLCHAAEVERARKISLEWCRRGFTAVVASVPHGAGAPRWRASVGCDSTSEDFLGGDRWGKLLETMVFLGHRRRGSHGARDPFYGYGPGVCWRRPK
jgi:hypothetical protein